MNAHLIRIGNFVDGLAVVEREVKMESIDMNEEVIVPCHWDEMYGFSDGLAPVRSGNKWGFVDRNGKLVVPCRWDEVYDFKEGLAPVKANGKWGYVDQSGRLVISCKWDGVGFFSDGYAPVKSKCLTLRTHALLRRLLPAPVHVNDILTNDYKVVVKEYLIDRTGRIVREL